MKLTKKRLKDFASNVESRVLVEISRSHRTAQQQVIDKYWQKIDPDFKSLKEHMKNVNQHRDSNNSLIELLEVNNIRFYGKYHTDAFNDFEKFKELFFSEVIKETIPGMGAVNKKYLEEKDSVKRMYQAIRSNLEKMTAKNGLEYLKELGMDVDGLEEVDSQVPMILIDKTQLRLPKQE